MHKSRLRLAFASSVLILSAACTPTLFTHTNPRGLDISGQLINYGEPEMHLVSLSVKRQDKGPTWKAEFEDGTNEVIMAEDIPGLTILKWKVDRERMKTLTATPYRLRIKGEGVEFATTVSFNSQGRQFSGHLLLDVVAHLVAGH
jgi:hypothetical protein